jgi:hypothetical protein
MTVDYISGFPRRAGDDLGAVDAKPIAHMAVDVAARNHNRPDAQSRAVSDAT